MFCRMLAWRAVAAPDVITLRVSTEVTPPAPRCQTLHIAIPTWLCSSANSWMIFLHRCFLLVIVCQNTYSGLQFPLSPNFRRQSHQKRSAPEARTPAACEGMFTLLPERD